MNRITLATFRRLAAAEETMMRGSMPLTSARDLAPLPAFHAPSASELVAARSGSRLVRPVPALTYTLAEAVR